MEPLLNQATGEFLRLRASLTLRYLTLCRLLRDLTLRWLLGFLLGCHSCAPPFLLRKKFLEKFFSVPVTIAIATLKKV